MPLVSASTLYFNEGLVLLDSNSSVTNLSGVASSGTSMTLAENNVNLPSDSFTSSTLTLSILPTLTSILVFNDFPTFIYNLPSLSTICLPSSNAGPAPKEYENNPDLVVFLSKTNKSKSTNFFHLIHLGFFLVPTK